MFFFLDFGILLSQTKPHLLLFLRSPVWIFSQISPFVWFSCTQMLTCFLTPHSSYFFFLPTALSTPCLLSVSFTHYQSPFWQNLLLDTNMSLVLFIAEPPVLSIPEIQWLLSKLIKPLIALYASHGFCNTMYKRVIYGDLYFTINFH